MTDGIFTDPTEVKPLHEIDPEKDYSAELIGEGKKYADVKLLAKSRLEADNHIDRLEKENKGIRAELEKRLTLEELMTKLTQQTKDPVVKENNQNLESEGKQDQPNPASGITAEQLQQLVDSRLAVKQQEVIAQTNLTFAKSKLKETFGDNYVQALDDKCKELGVTREYLNKLAIEQPNVLLRLVGGKPTETNSPSGNTRSIDASKQLMSSPNTNDGFHGQKYYTNLLKSDPATFWSAKTQLEMHNMAMKDPQRYISQ